MSDLTITRRLEEEPEKTLREYVQPTLHAIKKPMCFLIVIVEEYEIVPKLIIKLKEMAFKDNEMKILCTICFTIAPFVTAKGSC
jgi:hypothetical protein